MGCRTLFGHRVLGALGVPHILPQLCHGRAPTSTLPLLPPSLWGVSWAGAHHPAPTRDTCTHTYRCCPRVSGRVRGHMHLQGSWGPLRLPTGATPIPGGGR